MKDSQVTEPDQPPSHTDIPTPEPSIQAARIDRELLNRRIEVYGSKVEDLTRSLIRATEQLRVAKLELLKIDAWLEEHDG